MLPYPQVIDDLAKSNLIPEGQIYSAEVHSLIGLERKKRTELVIAVYHVGAKIYDVSAHHSTTILVDGCSRRMLDTASKTYQ